MSSGIKRWWYVSVPRSPMNLSAGLKRCLLPLLVCVCGSFLVKRSEVCITGANCVSHGHPERRGNHAPLRAVLVTTTRHTTPPIPAVSQTAVLVTVPLQESSWILLITNCLGNRVG